MAAPIGPRPRTPADDAADQYRQHCAARLTLARERAGLSTYALAQLCGFSDASIITRYEAGVLPSTPRQFAIAWALGVTPGSLWAYEGSAADAHAAADAAAAAVGNMAEKCSALLAERDGWFRDLEEIAAELEGEVDSDGPTTVQLIDLVRSVRDERDRLRAVVRKLVAAAGLAIEGAEGEWLSYACEEYAERHGFTTEERAVYQRALGESAEATDGP